MILSTDVSTRNEIGKTIFSPFISSAFAWIGETEVSYVGYGMIAYCSVSLECQTENRISSRDLSSITLEATYESYNLGFISLDAS